MSITCSLRYYGSDSLIQVVTLQCVPVVGDTLFLDGNIEVVVKNIQHEISVTGQTHKIVVHYSPC